MTSFDTDTPNTFGSSSPAILERPTTIERRKQYEDQDEMTPADDEWLLRIYNDGVNTREYVARCLVQVVGLPEERAFYTMMRAHNQGIAIVGDYKFEIAEMYEQQLGNNGIKCDIVSASGC
jgi:ATP-dependent Clp protease adapter protein ClpS